MVQRVLIGDMNGGVGTVDMRIRMSRPGYDVMTTLTPEQLAFDSAWLDTAVIYMTGTVFVPKTVFGGYVQVNFPDTLPSLPSVIIWQRMDYNSIIMGSDKSTNTSYIPSFVRFSQTYLRFQANISPAPYDDYVAGYIVLRSLT